MSPSRGPTSPPPSARRRTKRTDSGYGPPSPEPTTSTSSTRPRSHRSSTSPPTRSSASPPTRAPSTSTSTSTSNSSSTTTTRTQKPTRTTLTRTTTDVTTRRPSGPNPHPRPRRTPSAPDLASALALHTRSCALFGPTPAAAPGKNDPRRARGATLPSAPTAPLHRRNPSLESPLPLSPEEDVAADPDGPHHADSVPATTHYWTSDATRRREYAALDREERRGVRGLLRRILPRGGRGGRGGLNEVESGGNGSVRRLRLDLE
ncbi:hypothetical protein EJ06DRAFT_528457 [Trichodelitschia bisporula]|uniref:Uncharacterized protein n=1 Tax=Trichodelitschia bisporula TaxID=703511 RepID=A0A6G1I2Y8_9PEZI|nr:hypothetical protein EJ06DRAFT_528457 [Trichodelitschia bisporula]